MAIALDSCELLEYPSGHGDMVMAECNFATGEQVALMSDGTRWARDNDADTWRPIEAAKAALKRSRYQPPKRHNTHASRQSQ